MPRRNHPQRIFGHVDGQVAMNITHSHGDFGMHTHRRSSPLPAALVRRLGAALAALATEPAAR
jgi:hypothetical protein